MLESHCFQAARGVANICMLPPQRRRMIPSAGHAGVAKLAYAQDLKSCGLKGPYGFDPRLLHQFSIGYPCATSSPRAAGRADCNGTVTVLGLFRLPCV